MTYIESVKFCSINLKSKFRTSIKSWKEDKVYFSTRNKFIFVKTNFNLEQKSVKTEEKQHLILKDSILQLQGLLPLLKHTWIVHLLHTRSHKDKSP